MPPREWRLRVQDIQSAVRKIQVHTAGMSYDEFVADAAVLEAVLYNFMVIGEAANQIPEEVRARHPSIPWRGIRETRNIVVHVYFGVKYELIWATIESYLAPLDEQLRELLAAEAEGDS